MAIPELTTEQRRENLAKAMELRKQRAELRAELGNGMLSVGDLIAIADRGDKAAGGMRVKQMISALPGYGLKRTQEIMRKIGIADNKRVGGLGVAQIRALMEKLDGVEQ